MTESVVTLTASQLITAGEIGVRRWAWALAHNCRGTHGGLDPQEPGAIDRHVRGAMSEYAVAKAFNLFWEDNLGTIGGVDVGGMIEVRYIDDRSLRLIVQPENRDDLPFVLVLIELPRFKLLGWMLGSEAKQDEFWSDPAGGRPAYFVPQRRLHPMPALYDWVDERVRSHFLNGVTHETAA